jgi:hypothetical protein
VEDQRIGRLRPLRRRRRGAELLLDDFRIVAARDADPVRDAQHVAIHGQSRNAKGVAQNDVGRLAADAGKRGELRHRLRDVPMMPFADRCRHAGERFGLGAEEAGRLNLRLELGGGRPVQRRRVWIALEQRRRDLVHALVGALRGENRRDQELVRRGEVKLGIRAGMLALELLHDGTRVSPRLRRLRRRRFPHGADCTEEPPARGPAGD